MSSINNRILEIFNSLNIKQVEFAQKIGVSQAYISKLFKVNSDKTPSERIIKIIINEYNVNESWLRTGKGEMFETISRDEIDNLAKRYNLNPSAKKIIENFVTLEEEEMKAVLNFISKISEDI